GEGRPARSGEGRPARDGDVARGNRAGQGAATRSSSHTNDAPRSTSRGAGQGGAVWSSNTGGNSGGSFNSNGGGARSGGPRRASAPASNQRRGR
ncbi:MAG: DEAD/DEAH box helicase, partial [Specibacter sp.]